MSNRKIRIKYEVRGNKAVVRSMREVEGQTAKGGKAADAAATAEKSFAESLADRSAAADKALKKTEGLFAGSDRLLSIVGKVTGALGLGALAYKGITGAIELFTGSQKEAKKQADALTRSLKKQADQIKRLKGAQGGVAGAIGVDLDRLSVKELKDATILWDRRNQAREKYLNASIDMVRKQEAFKKELAGVNKEYARLVRLQKGSFAGDERIALKIKRLDTVRSVLKATEQAAIDAASNLEDKFFAADNKFADLRGKALLRLDPFGGDPKAAGAASDDAGGGGNRKPKRPAPPVAPDWLKQQIAFFDASVERSKQLHDALEGLRPAWERLVMTPANVKAIADILQRDLAPLMPVVDAGAAAFGHIADEVARAAKEMANGRAAAQVWNAELDRMADFGWAAAEGLAAAAVDAIFFGESGRKALAEMAKAATRQAGIEFLMSLARGTTAATLGDPRAPGHFKAAGLWAAVTAVAGATAAAVGGGGGSSSAGSQLPPPTRRDLPRDRSGEGGLTLNVTNDFKGRPFHTLQEIEDAQLRGATAALERTGSPYAARFRRAVGQ